MKTLSVCSLLVCLFLSSSCTRRELTYCRESQEVNLTVDWSRAGMDEEQNYGATAVFYPKDGGNPITVLMGDRKYAQANLPVGHYSVVVFNRSFGDFGNIAFRGKGAFGSLEACAKKEITEKLAADTKEEVEISEGGNPSLHFTPKRLTHRLRARIHIKGLNNLKEALCTLGNLPSSVFVCSGKNGGELVSWDFRAGKPLFGKGSGTEGTITGYLQVFSLDEKHPVSLKIKALLKDGKTIVERTCERIRVYKEADASGQVLICIDAYVNQALPDVKPGKDSGFDADVSEWGKEEHKDIHI